MEAIVDHVAAQGHLSPDIDKNADGTSPQPAIGKDLAQRTLNALSTLQNSRQSDSPNDGGEHQKSQGQQHKRNLNRPGFCSLIGRKCLISQLGLLGARHDGV